MAINKTAIGLSKPIIWDGVEVAQVRGLTPNDLASVLSQEGGAFEAIMSCMDNVDFVKTTEGEVANALKAAAPSMVATLSKEFPNFLATVIAIAGDGDDEAVEFIRTKWPLGLQFEAMIQICSLTFSGPEGFRAFVGNVFALTKLTDTLTGAKPLQAASKGSANGAGMSLS